MVRLVSILYAKSHVLHALRTSLLVVVMYKSTAFGNYSQESETEIPSYDAVHGVLLYVLDFSGLRIHLIREG